MVSANCYTMIRFYTTTIHPRSLSNELFKNYKKMTNYKETFFYTQQGIYKVEKGKLYKIIENNNKSILYNNIEGFDIIELTESNNKNNFSIISAFLLNFFTTDSFRYILLNKKFLISSIEDEALIESFTVFFP